MHSDVAELVLSLVPRLEDHARKTEEYVLVLCPFHSEKTPSCSIRRDTPVFFCHGCKESGHVRKLLALGGVSDEAARTAIERLRLPGRLSAAEQRRRVYGNDPYRGHFILDDVETLIPYAMTTPLDLIRDGFTEETLKRFEVGWDPMNLRITYPLRNIYGELVGISGRTTWAQDDVRYKIYKHELITRKELQLPPTYNIDSVKKAMLWNFHTFFPRLISENTTEAEVILVEGFKACMWVAQCGYQNVAALIGSYFSDEHAELLARIGCRVRLFLDNNKAGFTGTEKAALQLHKRGIPFTICRYPDNREQPDHLEVEEAQDAISEVETYIQWRETHDIDVQAARGIRGIQP